VCGRALSSESKRPAFSSRGFLRSLGGSQRPRCISRVYRGSRRWPFTVRTLHNYTEGQPIGRNDDISRIYVAPNIARTRNANSQICPCYEKHGNVSVSLMRISFLFFGKHGNRIKLTKNVFSRFDKHPRRQNSREESSSCRFHRER